MIENILRGTRSIFEEVGGTVRSALQELGRDGKVVHLETAYFWPTIYGLTGRKVESIGDLKTELEEASKIFDERVEFKNALNAGMASLLALEIAEAVKYTVEKEPYSLPCIGFVPDGALRSISLRFADGTIPGIVILLGEAKSTEDAKIISEGLVRMGLLTFLVGPVIDQLRESEVELGVEKLLVPLGTSLVSVVHAVNLAVRVALIFGKIDPGDKEKISEYIESRLRICAIVLGDLNDKTLAIGSGAISLGTPVLTDRDLEGLRVKFDITIDQEKCEKCLE